MREECACGLQHATSTSQFTRQRISVSRFSSEPSSLGETSTGDAAARASKGVRVVNSLIVSILRWLTERYGLEKPDCEML